MEAATAPERGRADREAVWWLAVAAMTGLVAAGWAPLLTRPLAANHLGNVAARYGLQVRNLYESGIIGSDFGADWAPYRVAPYAHHPPLLNMLDAIVGLVPGDGVIQLRVAPYALALAVVPVAAVLLRTLALSWPATLLATGALAGTGYFWVYGPIAFDLAFILGLAAATTALGHVRVERRPATPAWVAALAAITSLASWPGVAFAWALTARLLLRRGTDRTSVIVATGTLAGTAVTFAYVVGISGWSALVDQTETRTTGGSYGPTRWARLVGGHLRDMLPPWYLVLLLPAIVLGLIDHRTRVLTGISACFAVAWIVVLNEGAVVHDYWGYLLLVPGLLGTAALVDRVGRTVARRRGPNVAAGLAAAAAMLVIVTFVSTAWGSTAERYVHAPGDAGHVIGRITPPAGQMTAWSVSFPYGRVLSYEWDLPTREITDVDLPGMDPDDLVFVDGTVLPAWWPTGAPPTTVARRGDYSVVTVRSLIEALEDDPFEL